MNRRSRSRSAGLLACVLALAAVPRAAGQESPADSAPAARITVRLLDARWDRPLPEADAAFRIGRAAGEEVLVESANLVTGEDGTVEFLEVPAGILQLQVHVRGFARFQTEPFEVEPGEERWIDVPLAPGCGLRGVVHAGDLNVPLAGARVTLLTLDHPDNTAITGEDGTFEFTNLSAGDHVLLVDGEGHAAKERSFTAAAGGCLDLGRVDLDRDEQGWITMDVVSAPTGEPVRPFVLEVVWTENGEEVGLPVEVEAADLFTLRVPPGEVSVRVEAAGFRPLVAAFRVLPGVRIPVRLELNPTR